MPANTPIFGFPYPLGTDPVAQGDNVIQELAEDVETVLNNQVGLRLITTVTFNSEASKVVDNVFSANYVNYKVVLQLGGVSNANVIRLTLITDTGTERTTGYWGTAWGTDYATGPTTLYSTGAQSTHLPLGYAGNSTSGGLTPLVADFMVGNPWSTSTRTAISGTHTGINAGNWYIGGTIAGTYNTANERHRGFWIRCSANTALTGTVSVYGYK